MENQSPLPLYIFDLDGTLADISHRKHFVESDDPDWDAFFNACVHDTPNKNVITTLKNMPYVDILFFSGRSSSVRAQTIDWISQHTNYRKDYIDNALKMRDEGDYTPDEVLKMRWYDQLSVYDKQRLVVVFDDRQKVVDAWRAKGVTCFQVAPGDF